MGRRLAFALTLAVSAPALAQDFDAPVDRDYTIDYYQGAALGSVRIIGMGGSATAMAQGSAGAIFNPAAPAVRPATSNDSWDWDWHLDSLSPAFGSDYDNNGIETTDVSFEPTYTIGIVGQYKKWGIAITDVAISQENNFVDRGMDARTITEAGVTRLSVARSFFDDEWVLGAGFKLAQLSLSQVDPDSDKIAQELFSLDGAGFEAGVVWKPKLWDLRLGASLSTPVISDSQVGSCDPLDCAGYILPNRVKIPWRASVGIAGRLAPTHWNQQVKKHYRDEKALLWALDVTVHGKVADGAGLEAFGQHMLQPSGQSVSHSLRGGVDYEWFPGRFRVRGGSYWEGGRFLDDLGEDIPGRLHLTLGFDLRLFSFDFWDDLYRVRLSWVADAARDFGNSGLSIGFWH